MMNRTVLSILSVALLAFGLAWTPTAQAESRETDALTLGWMTENADLVAVLQPLDQALPREFRVISRIRGVKAPERIRVTLRPGRGPVLGRVLAFLKRSGETWVPVTAGASLRSLAIEAPGSRAADEPMGPSSERTYVESYATSLAADGSVRDPAALATLIPKYLAAEDGAFPFSAGRDLVRHESVLAALTPASRVLVTDALLRDRKPDQDLAAVVIASGFAGDERADERLVQLLRDGKARNLRRHLVQAIARRSSDEQVRRLTVALKDATPQQQMDLAIALGAQARPSAEAPLIALLASKDSSVRTNAAHGVGTLARALRKQDRERADPDAPRRKLTQALVPLRRLLSEAKTRNARRASVWALAQLDTPESWALLKKLATEDSRDDIRSLARAYSKRPSLSLVLDDRDSSVR